MSTPESQFTGSVTDFAKRVREKYPNAYDDLPDEVLVDRIVAKHPTYKSAVKMPDFDAPVTNEWGARRSYGGHTGVDVGYGKGERVGVPLPGRVTFAGERSGYGNRVEVDHGNGIITTYSHLDGFDVKEGDEITPDRPLGRVGNSGGDYRPHLHFEVLRDGQKVNAAETPYRPRRISSSPATPVSSTSLQSPEAGATLPAISQTQPAPVGAPPPPLNYVDEAKERPEDFADLQPKPVLAPSLYTSEGRALRDRKIQAEREGGALYRIPVGTGRPEEAARLGAEYLAKETGASPEFVADWLKRNNLGLQFGEQQSAPTGYAVIPTEAVGRLRRDYRASLSLPARAVANVREIAATHSPGEVLVGVGGEAASGAMRGMDIGTRPLQAASGAFWAKIRGASNKDAVRTAVQEFFGENPELAKNVIAEALRDSETLKGINPRLPELTGFLAEMVADPANLIPAGLVARGVSRVGKVAKQGGRLARVAGELRDLGVYVPDVPKEAFKPAGDSRVLGDLTRRIDAVNVPELPVNANLPAPRLVKKPWPQLTGERIAEPQIEDLPDIPVSTPDYARVVFKPKRTESPSVESTTPEAVLPEKSPVEAQSVQAAATETVILHSNPRIDGGRVVGQTSDGRLRVENNEGGVSVVKHPRRGGNREAALVRREVTSETAQSSDTGVDADIVSQPRQTQAVPGIEGESQVVGPIPKEAITTTFPDRVAAPVPDAPAFRERIKSTFNLSDEQADAVTEIAEARARAWGKERGKNPSDYYAERFGGIVRGGEPVGEQLNQTAWHGSPHRFERFSSEKIGTGEGAQAYGHGLYFAGNRSVAKYYKERLSPTPSRPYDGGTAKVGEITVNYDKADPLYKVLFGRNNEFGRTAAYPKSTDPQSVKNPDDLRRILIQRVDGVITQRRREIFDATPNRELTNLYKERRTPEQNALVDKYWAESNAAINADPTIRSAEALRRELVAGKTPVFDLAPAKRGALYKVDLAPEESDYLLWDKPLSEQSPKVKAALVKGGIWDGKSDFNIYDSASSPFTGASTYEGMVGKSGGQRAASEKLRELGIRGIKYLDGSSRGRGEGSHNYVIFDDADVSITEVLRQQNKAAVEFMADGRAVLRAFQKADVSSAVHELAHVFRRDLSPELLKDAEDALGVKGEWTKPHEEQFARGFERYLKTGAAPSEKLRRVYAQFKDWLTEIYGAVRGKAHPLKYKPNEKLVTVFDRMLDAAPKGDYGQFTNALHKAPSDGTPAFFENAQVKRALGLKADASTEDVRWKLAAEVGKPRASHVTPEDAIKWADSKNLRGAARDALDSAVEKYRATVKAPTAYQQTGIRRRNVDPTTQSLAEFVRASGGIRVDRDLANRGELSYLTNKESGTSGLVRKDGVSVHEMARMAAEEGYPVATGGGYYTDKGFMERAAGSGEPDADAFIEALSRDLQGEKVYSHQREVDYETLYRQQHPEDNTDALDSFLSNEENGILFDKVQDGTATRREVEDFRRAAGEAGLFPEYVRTVIAQGKRAQAEGVQAPLRDEAATDFDFRDDSLDADQPAWLYQSDHKPKQLGFTNEGLIQESARRDTPRPQLADARTEAAKRALGSEAYARLSSLKDSPVARIAVEVERRVNPSNSQNAPDVMAALSKLAELKRTKQTVDDFLNQGSLFGGRELTPAQERILSVLDKSPRKVLDEAFPAEAQPRQDVLFQSDHAPAARRQRAYKALLEAKGQGSLSPDLRRNPATRTRMGTNRSADPNQPALAPDLATPKDKPTFKDQLADIANAPRSLKSSVDLSAAMRQGAMFTLTHPARSARIFFGQQLRSLSFKGYEKFVADLKADSDIKAMKDSGLHLTSLSDEVIGNREEAFASKLAGKVPLVKRSENAYVTFLDSARAQWFKQLKAQADDAATKAGKPVTKEQYEAIARFVNRATGRGDLGKGAINDAAPLLNSVFFAPRYAVSKVQVFDPRTYSRLPPGARKMAIRQAVQYFGTIAATATLLKYGFGAEVGTDPEQSDFLKVKVGNTRYDLAAGSGQYVTLAARLARNLANRANGTKDEQFKGLEDNVTRFLRYKLAPVPAAALNAYQKRDAVGQKTDVSSEALGLITPIYLTDLYEAFQQEGITGLAKTAPGFVGVGVQTYSERPKSAGAASAVPVPRLPKPPRVSGGN